MANQKFSKNKIDQAEWQMVSGDNEWVFGIKIRGIIRELFAEIYFDPDNDNPEGGWRWMVHAPTPIEVEPPNGFAINYQEAIKECEQALGINNG
jgi:hypothetical protein